MKQAISVFLFIIIVFTSNAQEQKNSLSGKIPDTDNNKLPGSNVIIADTKYGVNAIPGFPQIIGSKISRKYYQ